MKLHRVEVVRWLRQYTTVYVSTDDNDLNTDADSVSEAIKDRAYDLGFDTDWEAEQDCEIASICDAEEDGTTIEDVTPRELLRLEETDND